MGLLDSLRTRNASTAPVTSVALDERGITCFVPGQGAQSLAWESLMEVGILTTDDGPFGDDVFWVLVGELEAAVLLIPQGAIGTQVLLARLQELPGFDNSALISAMTCTDDSCFVCWQRAAKSA